MLEESKDLIVRNFLTLMKECNVDVLKDEMVKKNVFTASEIEKIFASDDARHNKRIFFFNIQKKEQAAFDILVDLLKKTNQHKLAKLLTEGIRGCKPYCEPPNIVDVRDIITPQSIPFQVSVDTEKININVVPSTEFYDTKNRNYEVEFYNSRSKKRGRVLIINNYRYADEKNHPFRNGADVDSTNLLELFTQMGGWEINHYENQTKEQMSILITLFALHEENYRYDICFVIVMGHGSEQLTETIIYGVDGKYLAVSDVQKHFTNDKCRGFRGKPKVFLFQVCRGSLLDHTIMHTETDSAQHSEPSVELQVINTHIRTEEDILVGYATLLGYKAHRDPNRGSWYIELFCKNFMKYAHKHTVGVLLQMVDQDLRKRKSEAHTMQTAEVRNKGFKNLYLNPGIYYEDGTMKRFNE